MTVLARLRMTLARLRPLIAWLCFIAAVIFMGADIADLTITGLFILGVVMLALWAWLLNIFTTAFWVADGPTDISRLDRLDGVGNRKDLS